MADWHAPSLWGSQPLLSLWHAGHSFWFSGPPGQSGPAVSSLKNQILIVLNWSLHLEEEAICNLWDVIWSQQVFLILPAIQLYYPALGLCWFYNEFGQNANFLLNSIVLQQYYLIILFLRFLRVNSNGKYEMFSKGRMLHSLRDWSLYAQHSLT